MKISTINVLISCQTWASTAHKAKNLTLFLLFSLLTLSLSAQNWNKIIKAVASDRSENDNFGYSVAISGDYAIVGAHNEDENATGGDTRNNAGAAYIFKRTGTTWLQEAKIVASDRAVEDNFGNSVAISGDYVIVGAYNEDENAAGANTQLYSGSAYIFKRTGTTWVQEAKIVASDRAVEDNFGYSVAISGDYAIVGAYNEDENATGGDTKASAGSAYIFKRTGTSWAQEAKIVASDRTGADFFGNSVAISGDYAIVGAFLSSKDENGANSSGYAGSAYIFKRTGTSWAQMKKMVPSRAPGATCGISVAISGDYAIVGAIGTNFFTGTAYIFKRTGTLWELESGMGGSEQYDYFGYSVAISGDYVIVGANKKDYDRGSAYIFKRTGTSWARQAQVVTSERYQGGKLGSSVAISDDYAIVGAYLEDLDATEANTKFDAGSAYFLSRVGTSSVEASNNNNTGLKVSPNPVTNHLTLTNTEGSIKVKATITDIAGRTLIQQTINTPQAEMNVSSLAKGLYLLTVETTDGRRGVQKFVKN